MLQFRPKPRNEFAAKDLEIKASWIKKLLNLVVV